MPGCVSRKAGTSLITVQELKRLSWVNMINNNNNDFHALGLVSLQLLLVSLTFGVAKFSQPNCNIYNGPPGQTKCVKFGKYEDYQWSACLSNSYIRIKSGGDHACRYNQASYCWYQCQLEFYHLENGAVGQACKCNPKEEHANVTSPSLPAWCYSPTGDSCHWYQDCLEKRFKCSGTDYGYAIDFGTKFCQQYEKNYHLLSKQGKEWVDGVRKCMQVSLVPFLRDFMAKSTCKQIRNTAMYSHDCCYSPVSSCTPRKTLFNMRYPL